MNSILGTIYYFFIGILGTIYYFLIGILGTIYLCNNLIYSLHGQSELVTSTIYGDWQVYDLVSVPYSGFLFPFYCTVNANLDWNSLYFSHLWRQCVISLIFLMIHFIWMKSFTFLINVIVPLILLFAIISFFSHYYCSCIVWILSFPFNLSNLFFSSFWSFGQSLPLIKVPKNCGYIIYDASAFA